MVYGYSKYLERNICIERGLVKPLLKGEDVHRYEHLSTDRFVVFPYKIENGKANLYSEKELSEIFPDGYAYLKECEEILRGREKGRFNIDGEWFQFGRKQGILSAEFEKLVAPDISMGGNFTYDSKGVFYQTTTVYGYLKKPEIKEGYKFWMALFNSRLFWWYLKNTGTVLANGFFRFKPDYVKPFPVPEIIPPYTEHLISTLCDYILFIKGQNTNLSDLVSNKLIFEYFERIIDGCIYEIYFGDHMKELNINIIDSAIGLIKPIEGLLSNEEKRKKILDTFISIKKTDNEIRNRLDLLTIKSPKVLKVIIED